jgi:hypothetical protein
MRHGLRYLQATLVVLCIAAVNAAGAQAYIYWAVSGTFGQGGTTLGRGDLDGTGVMHSFVTGADNPSAIAVDGTYIYWSNFGTKSIGRANLNGSDPDPTWIPDLPQAADGLAVDGSYIYWSSQVTGYVGRATISGGDVTPDFIDAGSTSPDGIAIDPTSGTLYIGEDGQIDSVLATGGSPIPVGQSFGSEVQVPSLAVAGGFLYYGLYDNGVGTINRMTIDGIDPTTLVSDLEFPGGVATDGTYLYWTDFGALGGSNVIGRGLIDSQGLSDPTSDFISEPNWPLGVAVNGGIDPTTTTVSCVPKTLSVGQQSACSASVADSASASVPAGTVNFTASGGAFFLGNPCTLAPNASGGASCTLGAEPTTSGTQTITVAYSGNAVHQPSSATSTLCAGTCGKSPPPPDCVVPKLKGKTLAAARKLLSKAHCALGKVTKPKVKKHHKQPKLVVSSTKPGAGAKLSNGAKVALKLVAAPKKTKR